VRFTVRDAIPSACRETRSDRALCASVRRDGTLPWLLRFGPPNFRPSLSLSRSLVGRGTGDSVEMSEWESARGQRARRWEIRGL